MAQWHESAGVVRPPTASAAPQDPDDLVRHSELTLRRADHRYSLTASYAVESVVWATFAVDPLDPQHSPSKQTHCYSGSVPAAAVSKRKLLQPRAHLLEI